MSRAAAIDDLFGHVPQAGELGLADEPAETRAPLLVGGVPFFLPPGGHTKDTIRECLHAALAYARAAQVMPWNARELRHWTSMVPYMAEWLKNGEGDRLLAEFKAEMDRLNAPADQVAPNWREMWGIAE